LTSGFHFAIDENADPAQRLAPPSELERFEGVAFSSAGNLIAVATASGNGVLLYRQKADGRYEDAPYSRIGEPACQLRYPHDVAFAACGDGELLVVAQRGEVVTIFQINPVNTGHRIDLVQEISGPEAKLASTDGAALVPPDNRCLAVCNLVSASINFYQRRSGCRIGFEPIPFFELTHPSLCNPDGLAFTRCGSWLAVANHGNHSVSIFERRNNPSAYGELRYDHEPVTVICDPRLHYPHSLAFTPWTNHLVVTNAGATYVNVYPPESDYSRTQWSQSPILQKRVGREGVFIRVNAANKMEGGAKGIAIYKNNLAICSPEFGVEIYRFDETVGNRRPY
jgi:DNA-binding beta-propeller fold protein YncE